MAAVCALVSCSRMIPLRATLSRSVSSFNSCCRRHPVPVAGPEVGAEHHDAARLQQVERRRRHLRNRESERTACSGVRRRDTVQRHLVRRDAAVDFLDGRLAGLYARQDAMLPGVVSDGVAFGRDPAHQVWMFRGGFADQEECGMHAFGGQRRQHPRGRGWPRARHRMSARLRDPPAAASAESFSTRRAASWRHRRRECVRCRAPPCADSRPPAAVTADIIRMTKIAPVTLLEFPQLVFAGAYLSLRLVLPIG